MCVIHTLLVPCEDLLHVHLLGLGQGDEPDGTGFREPVCEGTVDLVHVMDSDGELAPLPSDGDVELLLHLHDGFQELVVDVDIEHGRTEEVGSDGFDALVDVDVDVRLADIVGLHSGLDVQECPHAPCKTLHAVEVGAVGEEFYGHIVTAGLGLVHIGTDHGDPVHKGLLGYFPAEQGAEVAVFEIDDRHANPMGRGVLSDFE